ncbi:MAG: carboxypeptidase regulatory-like domain-containing protein [Bryobacteraceae bacterium]
MVLLVILCLTGINLFAQGTASISGTVSDPSGAAIPTASIQVKNTGTGVTVNAESDSQGRYSVPQLAVGSYEIQTKKEGFQTTVRKGITLTVGAQPVVDFAMQVGQAQQTVTVEGQVTQVETTNSTVSALVDQKQMAELPLNGRNFEQLILLAPGAVSFTAVTSSGAQGRSSSYSVSGARPSGQALLLDGENMQTFWNRGLASITGSSLGVEAIGEFQTLTNTYGAQYGGNGVVVNSVSKSGTNNFHGSLYEFLRNSYTDARNGLTDPGTSPPPFRRNQFGGSIGGPIKQNKLFFFANYEGIQQSLTQAKTALVPACNPNCAITATDPAVAKAIAGALSLYPVAPSGIATVLAAQKAHENYILGRVDYNVNDKDSVYVRYLSDKAYMLEPFGGTSANMALWPGDDTSHNQFTTVEWRRIVSPTLVNIARASFSRTAANELPATAHPELQFFPGSGRVDAIVNVTGVESLGPRLFNPFVLNQNKYTEGDDLIWTKGAHTLRMGFSVVRFQTNSFLQQYGGTQWTFQSLNNFLAGNALRVVLTPLGNQFYSRFDLREIDFFPYIQDDWKVSNKLTVNLGLRWNFQTNPVSPHDTIYMIKDYAKGTGYEKVPNVMRTNPSTGNLAPRIGLAYDPFADHKTSIRAGFGMFHDMITPSVYWPALTGQPPWTNYTVPAATFAIPFTSSLTTPIPAVAPGWDYNNAVTPTLMQYNLTVQRELAQGTVLTVGYVGSRGIHLMNGLDQNPVMPTVGADGVRRFSTLVNGRIVPNARLNSNFGTMSDMIPAADSRYNSLQASVNRRFSQNVQVQAAYTYANCMENGASGLGALNNNTTSITMDPFNRAIDKARCAQDIRHTLRVNGIWTLPFRGNRIIEGWQISTIVSSATGLPFNINTGFDQMGTGMGTSPPSQNRPDIIAGCQLENGTIARWYNSSCFTVPAPGVAGNAGRNLGKGPNLQNTDISVSKDTKLTETIRLQFRAEFFNIFNHLNLALPTGAPASVFAAGAAGACTATGAGCGTLNANAGRITSTVTTPRQMQFGLKLIF